MGGCWLATREGHAAARCVQNSNIFFKQRAKLTRGVFLGAVSQKGVRAVSDALLGKDGFFAVVYRVLRAISAINAPVRRTQDEIFKALPLGVMTPLAAQGTAHQKDARPYSRAVKDRKFFD